MGRAVICAAVHCRFGPVKAENFFYSFSLSDRPSVCVYKDIYAMMIRVVVAAAAAVQKMYLWMAKGKSTTKGINRDLCLVVREQKKMK
jgi:hypothetical protein